MKGYIKVAAAVPKVTIADTKANIESITSLCIKMHNAGVKVAVFPEMSITGYTCGDLFANETLLSAAEKALVALIERSSDWELTLVVGLPYRYFGALYNVAAVIQGGQLIALIPKSYIPNYNEFYEKRWWASGSGIDENVCIGNKYECKFSTHQLFRVAGVLFGVEICEDLWAPVTPGCLAAMAGAEIMLNLSASDTVIGKHEYVKNLVATQSGRCISGYVYASAGCGESSTDLVFDGNTIIASNGRIVEQSTRWHDEEFYTSADIDVAALRHDRMVKSSFHDCFTEQKLPQYAIENIANVSEHNVFSGKINPTPFVPDSESIIAQRCEEILNIQSSALAQRLRVTSTKNIVLGISGGLDSTLALLVAVRTFDRLGYDRKGIHAITMPGFGTTDRTYTNAVKLIEALGTSFREISIVDAVNLHFKEIGHPAETKNVTYENSQARQRTLLLMDIANQVGGLVLGTGDLSELALGWATYNGDHMSMYGVNAGVPKTLVKYVVSHYADSVEAGGENAERIAAILRDIVLTPISPELIPADDEGNITQKTEDLVGPYELHDFFLYYTLRFGFGPQYIFERAVNAFEGVYDSLTILKWLRKFTQRFFSQQFKRSCLPDGPKVGSVCLSPRGDWRMPSDASAAMWLGEIDLLEKNMK